MKHVRLLVLAENLPQVSLLLAETEHFHPDSRPPTETMFSGKPGHDYREVFNQARSRLAKIARFFPLDDIPILKNIRSIEMEDLTALNDWLGEIWEQVSNYEEELHRLDESERIVREQQNALLNFSQLHINLGLLRGKKRFLDFQVGLIPRENLRQLKLAIALAHHVLFVYEQRDDQTRLVIIGPRAEESQITSVLAAAGFQSLPIPQELDREPAELERVFNEQIQSIEEKRRVCKENLARWGAPFHERLLDAQRALLLAEPFVTLDPTVHSAGYLAYLAGWVPARALPSLEKRLQESLTLPFTLTSRNPSPKERKLVPTVPFKNPWLAPFVFLVQQYGIPTYGEIDPTPWFAISFLLMFGMMFGDIGHGAVIALAAWFARHKIGQLFRFGILAGLSSMIFGAVFGSVFGYENIIHPLWMSPMHDPVLMLKVALLLGSGFIIIACILGILNRLALFDLTGALFEHHGLFTLSFYLGLLWGATNLTLHGEFGTNPFFMIGGSLLIIIIFHWYHSQASNSEKIMVLAIETLDTVIVYLSHTVSFLRVAAFSLNHVALSLAIFTLAGMMGVIGHPVAIFAGNLFVLILEGGIVMIQVLRLQYYEGFSRYFSGEGYAFAPLRLRKELIA